MSVLFLKFKHGQIIIHVQNFFLYIEYDDFLTWFIILTIIHNIVKWETCFEKSKLSKGGRLLNVGVRNLRGLTPWKTLWWWIASYFIIQGNTTNIGTKLTHINQMFPVIQKLVSWFAIQLNGFYMIGSIGLKCVSNKTNILYIFYQ